MRKSLTAAEAQQINIIRELSLTRGERMDGGEKIPPIYIAVFGVDDNPECILAPAFRIVFGVTTVTTATGIVVAVIVAVGMIPGTFFTNMLLITRR